MSMDGDEGCNDKRGSSEPNREMLAKYKAAGRNAVIQAADTSQPADPLDEDMLHDTGGALMEQGTSMMEGMSSRDITQSSISISEGEGDCDLEGMAGKIAELEELLQGKESVVEALSAEIDHLRAEACSPNSSQSHNSGPQYRDVMTVYHTKLQDFERAVNQRDNLIHDLTTSLEQALTARDALRVQLQSMANNDLIPADLGNCSSAQDRIVSLENALSEHKTMITQLNADLMRSHETVRKLEMERGAQNAELNDYKSRVNQLNEQIRVGAVENTLNIAETMEMQKQYEARVEKIKKDMQVILEKFTAETNSKTVQHEEAMQDLERKYQRELMDAKGRWEEKYRSLADRYNKELPDLESKHAKELSIFQAQLLSYKKTVESLKLELVSRGESQQSIVAEMNSLRDKLLHNQKDKEMLNEQIKLHKIQLEDLTSKYVAAASVLDSKESIERSLEEALTNVAMLKQENDVLKFKHDDLSARFAAAQSLIENNQIHERTMCTRIFDLEKSLSRLSGVSMMSEFNETTYQTFDDVAVQFHATRQKLEEKAELEKHLIDKVQNLEQEIAAANEELDRANLEKESYEKQVKDMKNICDKLRSDMEVIQGHMRSTEEKSPENKSLVAQSPDSSVHAKKLEESANMAEKLAELTEKLRKSEAECEHLKHGMAIAWEQCAEFEEKLNQTLAMNETRTTDSFVGSRLDDDRTKNSSKTSNDTFKTAKQCETVDKDVQTDDITNFEDRENVSTESLMVEIIKLREEKENLTKEVKKLSEKISGFEQISEEKSNAENEKLVSENNELRLENENLSIDQDMIDSLHKTIADLTAEKTALTRELSNLADKHTEELAAVRRDSMAEVEKLRNFMLTVGEGNSGMAELKAELERRHAREMEELRTYFEEKCLQMEKQYSDEIFSQQSKKMSDNDSEIEDLTDDMYFIGGAGGGGDCTNTNRQFVDNSNNQSPGVADKNKPSGNAKNAVADSNRIPPVDRLCQTEWDAALENGELMKLRAAYSNQLQEQVALAKLDIVNALQEQIQALLAVESDMEENWPPELLQLRNKFTSNAKRETDQLKALHSVEIKQLKEEHSRTVARIIERHQEEMKQMANDKENVKGQTDNSQDDNSLLRERDNLVKTCIALKELIADLIKYFAVCEEELNNTLISEVLRRQTSNEMSNVSEAGNSPKANRDTSDHWESPKTPRTEIKRVHFAPQCSEIVSLMNDDNLQSAVVADKEMFTKKIRHELENCLKRMKSESAEFLGFSLTPGESMLDLLSKQVQWTTKVNEDIGAKLSEAENLVAFYQEESRMLKSKVMNLQHNKKEIVTEGYGEHEESGNDIVDFTQLQEKARQAIMSCTVDNAYLLQLIDELLRYNDKMTDDTRREKDDLQQQIEAADKQLRATRKFLEEQASEREIERDDAARQINMLREQVKEREREKERDLRITSESSLSPVSSPVVRVLEATDINAAVEALESQMREMSSMMSDMEAKKDEVESELKVAVDKIWMLRDVIGDLEQQIQARIKKEETLIGQIEQLEEVIAAQTKNQHELVQELDSIKMGGENTQLNEHLTHLEEELRKHKLSNEHFNVNSSALKQMRIEIKEMQNQLDKRTRELESLHMCGSNLSISHPSEDVSIREQIDVTRCPTPDDPSSPPILPLDQLLKLKEKMSKHARAEEVAFKRIKDLDMQLSTYKIQNEELQAEQEILQQTASEQLFQMEAMRGRLEQQKQNAPFAQRQLTSRLELQLHEANTKLHSLEQTIADKELEVMETREQLQRVSELLHEKQKEFMNMVQTENDSIQELKDRLLMLEEEKKLLESKVGIQERAQIELPQLIDSMLADKNDEIDHLKEQLSKRDKQLQVYLFGNVDDNQTAKAPEQKNSARTLSDILSINSECEEYSEAIREGTNLSQLLPHNISTFKVPATATTVTTPPTTKESYHTSQVDVAEITSKSPPIQVPRLELGTSNSHSLSSICPRHSRISLDPLQTGDFDLKSPSSEDFVDSFENPKKSNGPTENDCTCSREEKNDKNRRGNKSDSTSKTKNRTLSHIQDLENQLKTINNELDEKTTLLNKRDNELSALQRNLDELRIELRETVETLTRDNEFYKNQYELAQASESKIRRDLEEVENTLKFQTEELHEYKNLVATNEKILSEVKMENGRLKNKLDASRAYDVELTENLEKLENLRRLMSEKDITIESIQTRNHEIENENKKLYEYKNRYDETKKELTECKVEIKRLTEGLNNRDSMIRRLEEMARRTSVSGSSSPGDDKDQEIHHLQEYLREKEKVIRQMSDDSKTLQRSLETIQNKMKESGNIVELRRKLKEERRFNGELKEMVEKLKHELETMKDESMRQSLEGADIEDMVQRELNLSAQLDQQIMDVIESESEEPVPRRIEKHLCNSLTIRPSDNDRTEKIVEKYSQLRQRFKDVLRANSELSKGRDDLEIEREMLKAQINEYESRIFQVTGDLEEKWKKVNDLNDEVTKQKAKVRTLEAQLSREKTAAHTAHVHDSDLISQLRIKLMASLDNEEKARRELVSMRQEHKNLELQLNSIKDQIRSQKPGETSVLEGLLHDEQEKYMLVVEKCEKEERNNAEMLETLKRLETERDRFEKNLEIAVEEQEKLASSLALAEGVKDHLEIDLKRTKEELKSRDEQCDWLEKRIKTLGEALAKRQQQTSDEQNEIKTLRRSVSNAREVILDLEADINSTKSQLAQTAEERNQMAQKLQNVTGTKNELKRKMQAAKEEEERLKVTINELQADLQSSFKREMELFEELHKERSSIDNNGPAKFVHKIKELNDALEKYSHDKSVLHEKLLKAREEREQFATRVKDLETQLSQNIQEAPKLYGGFTEAPRLRANYAEGQMTEKLQHFYGKYLRVDSRRKALVFQKRYLLCIVGGYQLSQESTLSILAQLTHTQRMYTTSSSNRKSPRVRFRSAALVIISINRMKWMVLRWRTGRRVGANAVLGNLDQSFVPLTRATSNHSPPVRERPAASGSPGGFSMEIYLQRFMDIRQTLGLAMPDTEI